jgi:predicted metal-dependent enzyme (double-stranded beta helix superfamily)
MKGRRVQHGRIHRGLPQGAAIERAECAHHGCRIGDRAPARAGLVPLYQSAELTILNVVWAPGMSIFPHDHRMWAVIAVYEGREDNAFFKRMAGGGLVAAGEKQLEAGNAVLLGPQTIHAVTNPLTRPTGALQVYGGDFFQVARSEFDPATLQERPFDIERAKAVFVAANEKQPG